MQTAVVRELEVDRALPAMLAPEGVGIRQMAGQEAADLEVLVALEPHLIIPLMATVALAAQRKQEAAAAGTVDMSESDTNNKQQHHYGKKEKEIFSTSTSRAD